MQAKLELRWLIEFGTELRESAAGVRGCVKECSRTGNGQADLVRKSLADEREAYKGTPSEETKIENKKTIKRRKSEIFNHNAFG